MSTYADTLIRVSRSKKEALDELENCGDHAIIDGKFARAVGNAFGVNIETGAITDSRSELKSPELWDLEEGDTEEDVIGSMEVARTICATLHINYVPQFGRGSQFRECVKSIRNYIEKK